MKIQTRHLRGEVTIRVMLLVRGLLRINTGFSPHYSRSPNLARLRFFTMSSRPHVVVLGAGVSGLTSALQLAKTGKYDVTIVAGCFPGDLNPDPYYASPIAGANSLPVSAGNTPAAKWDTVTFKELWKIKDDPKTGIHVQDTVVLNRGEKDKYTGVGKWFAELLLEKPWFADVFPGFRALRKDELPEGIVNGSTFKSVCINVPIYLGWMVCELLGHGVQLKRGTVRHVCEAVKYAPEGKADLVVNCTGIRSHHLGGVEDKDVIPIRGQIAIVANEANKMFTVSGTDDAADEVVYVMKRPQAGGTVLGGSYQKGDWNTRVDGALAQRILKRCLDACPEMVNPGEGIEKLEVLRHVVGLRPFREGGVRIAKETIEGVKVVHNYGAGGFGYQASYGLADEVVELVEDSFAPAAKL